MEVPVKTIAIIGGGLCGIMSIAALQEEGHKPICFEKTDKHGGTFCYREKSTIGVASIMPTTVLLNSKENGAFSNFPPPRNFSTHLRHSEYYQYITEFYNHHNCEQFIRFNSEVIHVQKNIDYEKTGRLIVTVKNGLSGKLYSDVFDGVMVATGHFNVPKYVTFPGQDKFKGTITHTHSLKGVAKLKDRNVVIIGSGTSAFDAAVYSSSVAKNVYMSTRSGFHVLSRLGPAGYPVDHVLFRRYLVLFFDILPRNFISWLIERSISDRKLDRRLYPVKPRYHLLSKDPIINDGIASKLLSGNVVLKRDVKYYTENGVVFDGEETETGIDDVILATGYTFDFSYLDHGLLEIENGIINLYKCMYPANLQHATLVFIGFINPFGSGLPIGEIQVRWAAHMFSSKGKLPPQEVMMKEIIQRHKRNERERSPSEYNSVRTDWHQYLDNIASEFGVKPNIFKYLYMDFPLFLKLAFGPIVPYQYRLEGPHKWDGARNAILTSDERLLYPLKRNKRPTKSMIQTLYELILNLVPNNIFF